jgi:hypothetical protein
VRQVVIERRLTLAADDYVAHLATISAYLQLSAGDRALVLERIGEVLPASVDLRADVTVHVARLGE